MATTIGNQPDWSAIRAAYEAGSIAERALARDHGISHTAIQKRAKAEQWKRPGGFTKPSGGAVSRSSAAGSGRQMDQPGRVRLQGADPGAVSTTPALSGADGHKAIVSRGRDLVDRLMDELSATTAHVGEIEEMIEVDTAGDKDGRRRYAMMQAVTLSTRAGILKNLALAAKTLADAAPGKREERADAAKQAAKGAFAVPAGPRLAVSNG